MVRTLSVLALTVLLACSGADADLNRRVMLRLSRESTPAEQVSVVTKGHVVTLTGVVHSGGERELLERAAREVDGVARVDNRLVVDGPVELTGAPFLKHDPVDVLMRDEVRGRLDARAIGDLAIEVHDRVITLTGHVSAKQHDAALAVARDVARDEGRVDDRMVIDP